MPFDTTDVTTKALREPTEITQQWRSEAAVLQRRGEVQVARVLTECAAEIDGSLSDEFSTWLSVSEAKARSAFSDSQMTRLIQRYRNTPHVRGYGPALGLRACIVPRRRDIPLARTVVDG